MFVSDKKNMLQHVFGGFESYIYVCNFFKLDTKRNTKTDYDQKENRIQKLNKKQIKLKIKAKTTSLQPIAKENCQPQAHELAPKED